MRPLVHAPLFAGINGFGFAAEILDWKQAFHCEIDPFCQKIIKYYWPKSVSYEDITKTDFTIWRGKIDVLSGGFPCQPYSQAGKRLGKEDNRHLWPEMRRAIREIRPGWVVGENVRGLTNWNGGLVFDEIQADLETEGYEVIPFLLPACAVGAPHRRDRIWFIAHRYLDGLDRNKEFKKGQQPGGGRPSRSRPSSFNGERPTPNPNNERLQGSKVNGSVDQSGKKGDKQPSRFISPNWQNFPTQSPICGGNDGLPSKLDGVTFSKWRNESIKAYGNAIVPQVALQIFKTINKLENER